MSVDCSRFGGCLPELEPNLDSVISPYEYIIHHHIIGFSWFDFNFTQRSNNNNNKNEKDRAETKFRWKFKTMHTVLLRACLRHIPSQLTKCDETLGLSWVESSKEKKRINGTFSLYPNGMIFFLLCIDVMTYVCERGLQYRAHCDRIINHREFKSKTVKLITCTHGLNNSISEIKRRIGFFHENDILNDKRKPAFVVCMVWN